MDGTYRSIDEIGSMYFNRTLNDWAKFNINNRTKYDASISSGLAIMANQRHLYTPVKKESKISIKFARYDNKGRNSTIFEINEEYRHSYKSRKFSKSRCKRFSKSFNGIWATSRAINTIRMV